MTTGKAIVIGSIVVGACLLTSTGYLYLRDRAAAETLRQDKERAAKAEAEAVQNARAKAAWDTSVQVLPTLLELWINDRAGTPETDLNVLRAGRYTCLNILSVKAFAYSDVTWVDPKTLVLRGIAIAVGGSRKSGPHVSYYSWQTRYAWLDSNKWGESDHLRIEPIQKPGQLQIENVTLPLHHEAPCVVRLPGGA